MSTFALYAVGFALVIVGLAYAAVQVGVPAIWIVIGCTILTGVAIATGAVQTRRKDPG